jgi:predicted nucleotidyltransferase
MNDVVSNELEIIKDIIVRSLPVEQIYLFGSYAYGEPDSDSDLDLYVIISDQSDIREIDAMKLIQREIRDTKSVPVDVIVSKKKKFMQRRNSPTIERKIALEGKILYG